MCYLHFRQLSKWKKKRTSIVGTPAASISFSFLTTVAKASLFGAASRRFDLPQNHQNRKRKTVILSSNSFPATRKRFQFYQSLYRRLAPIFTTKSLEIHVAQGSTKSGRLKTCCTQPGRVILWPSHGRVSHLCAIGAWHKERRNPRQPLFYSKTACPGTDRDSAQKTQVIQVGKVFVDGKGVVRRRRPRIATAASIGKKRAKGAPCRWHPSAVGRKWWLGRILSSSRLHARGDSEEF